MKPKHFETTIYIRAVRSDQERFKQRCASANVSVSEAVRDLIAEHGQSAKEIRERRKKIKEARKTYVAEDAAFSKNLRAVREKASKE